MSRSVCMLLASIQFFAHFGEPEKACVQDSRARWIREDHLQIKASFKIPKSQTVKMCQAFVKIDLREALVAEVMAQITKRFSVAEDQVGAGGEALFKALVEQQVSDSMDFLKVVRTELEPGPGLQNFRCYFFGETQVCDLKKVTAQVLRSADAFAQVHLKGKDPNETSGAQEVSLRLPANALIQ